ncbi:hypothetical protein C8R44DRAFT_875086 [Mycena epipterygia]|nr:hypothetical protein C8R44DRAFT_875086 [Mycena epipterygia]
MIISEDDTTIKHAKDAGSPRTQAEPAGNYILESESAPPPYEAPYEVPSAPLLQQDIHAMDSPDASRFRTRAARRRRFLRFLLVAVVLVVAFTLVHSYLRARHGGRKLHAVHHMGHKRRRPNDD